MATLRQTTKNLLGPAGIKVGGRDNKVLHALRKCGRISSAFVRKSIESAAHKVEDGRIWLSAVDIGVCDSLPSLYESVMLRGPFVLDLDKSKDLVATLVNDQRWHRVTATTLLERQASASQ